MTEPLTPVFSGKMPWISPPASSRSMSSSSTSNSFNQLLSTAMLSGSLSSTSGNSGSTNMLLPMMLVLLEGLLASQANSTSTSSASSSSSVQSGAKEAIANLQAAKTTKTEETHTIDTADDSNPQGRPVGGVVTQKFHTGHNGIDFGVVVGTPVKATMSGKVIYAGWNNQGYGNLVIVENGPYRTYYAHLSSIPVQTGQQISSGSTIGLSGNTGNSTGPHLHYEVRKNQKVIDPTSFTLN